jgi:tetratricopeptide (TPR) repeat protein
MSERNIGDNEESVSANAKTQDETRCKVPLTLHIQSAFNRMGHLAGDAVNAYKRLFNVSPGDAKGLYLKKAQAADLRGDAGKCVEYAAKAAELAKDDPQVLYELGVAYEKNADPKAALEAYDQALKAAPRHAKAHYRSGIVQMGLRQYKAALKSLEAARQIEPDSAEVNYRLGLAHDRLSDYEKALKFFARAVEINPKFLVAHKNMALACESLGRHEEGLACLKRALEIEEEVTPGRRR